MQKLTLRTVGVRHVASDGKNDVGEFDEAHLRSYVASLPGSFTVPDSSTAAGQRPGHMPGGPTAAGVRPGGLSAGLGRARFSRAVEERKSELLLSDPELGELEAHRLASNQIAKQRPDLLADYRADAQKI
ncbi:MAG: hypothetical protein ABSF71_22135 [Terriglobia bacterium]|jgi:hypothetical protein